MLQSLYPRFLILCAISTFLLLTSIPVLQAQCPSNQTQVMVSITTDNYPDETTWELKNWVTGTVYATGGPYTTANNTYTQNICVPNDATIGFTIYDVYQDGICCGFGNGSYSVSAGSTTYASGGNFDAEETSLFIIEQQSIDLAAVSLSMPQLLLANTEHSVTGRIMNLGTTFVNSFTLNWQVGNGTIHTQNFSFPFPSGAAIDFTHEDLWMPTAGEHTLKVWATNINNSSDDNTENDVLERTFNALMQMPIRTILSEHFTNASCGPCAIYNPGFEATLNASTHPTASIKYHTAWPGFDPMYQENSADANARTSFYGVGGVPTAVMDGGQYAGNPGNVNQAILDYMAAISSGIIITVDESKTGNVVDIEVEIEALIPINSSNLRVHIVAVEKEVNYASAPGSNGEKDFPYVMRKMLPNSNGTTIASMSANSTATVDVSYTLPSFVDANEMRTVVFVQDNNTGFVYQSFLAPEIMGQNEDEQSPTIDAPETVACALSLSINSEGATCGESNGTATVSVSGGTAPLTYAWTNGANAPTLSNLSEGVYEVMVTDANDCTISETITIANTTPPTLQAATIDPTCEEANGIINIITNNGTAPFTYQWNNNDIGNTPNANSLEAGNYTVLVTDNVGCTALQTVTLEDAGLPNISLTGTEPSCNEMGLVAANISGGTAPYDLQWNTGETTENIEVSESGEYILTVIDANGCTSMQAIEIESEVDLPIVTVSSQAVCEGETSIATASVSGGTAPYQIEWSDGQTGETANDLSANVFYEIEVTDANGCKTSSSFSVEVYDSVEAVDFEATDASCNGNNGILAATAMGGTAPFSYDWNTGDTNQQIENLEAGTYSVIVTDANGCTIVAEYELQNLGAPNIELSATEPNCNSEGTIAANISGGTAPYTLQWNTGETDENINISEGGNYTLEVTDASGCVTTQTIEVEANTELPSLELSFSQPCGDELGSAFIEVSGGSEPYTIEWGNGQTGENADGLLTGVFYNVLVMDANGCSESQTFMLEAFEGIEEVQGTVLDAACGLVNGSISIQVVGGTPPFSFDWGTNETSNQIEDLAAGFYSVEVTDANGCTQSRTFQVEELGGIEGIEANATEATCSQENGSISLQIIGGTPPFSYTWNTGETSRDLQDIGAGLYEVLVTDANGCTAIENVDVKASDSPTVSIEVESANCNEANGRAVANVEGGAEPYTFSWENGSTTATAEDLMAGTYSLIVTDANGCEVTTTATISDEGAPDASFFVPFEFCIEDGDLTFVALQNTTGTFAVDGEAIEGDTWTPTTTGQISVTYTITENGCTSIEEQTVDIIEVFDAFWTIEGDVFEVCESDLPLTIVANNTSGRWLTDNENAQVLVSTDSQGNKIITFTAFWEGEVDLAAFTVTHEGGGDNCGSAYTRNIMVNSLPQTPEITADVTEVCGIETAPVLELQGFPEFCNCPVTFNVYDGEGNLLKEGDTYNSDAFKTADFISESGVYTFEVASVNGTCESERSAVTIEVFEEVTVNTTATPSCDNESGEAAATILSGTSPFVFEWNNGANTGIVTNLTPNDYQVVVTDANGCTSMEDVTIEELLLPTLDLGADIVAQLGESIVLEVPVWEGVTYLWSTGETSASILVSESGTYSLTVVTADGCETTDEIEVTFTTDIEAIEGLNEWKIYPNPANDVVFLQFDLQRNVDAMIEILDLAGRVYFSENRSLSVGEKQLSISTEDFPVGVYLMVLKDGDGVVVRKLVVE